MENIRFLDYKEFKNIREEKLNNKYRKMNVFDYNRLKLYLEFNNEEHIDTFMINPIHTNKVIVISRNEYETILKFLEHIFNNLNIDYNEPVIYIEDNENNDVTLTIKYKNNNKDYFEFTPTKVMSFKEYEIYREYNNNFTLLRHGDIFLHEECGILHKFYNLETNKFDGFEPYNILYRTGRL